MAWYDRFRKKEEPEKPDVEEEKLEEAELGEVPLKKEQAKMDIKRAKAEIKYYKAQAKADIKRAKADKGKSLLWWIIVLAIIGIILYLIITIVVPIFAGTYLAEQMGAGIIKTEAKFTNIIRPAKGHLNTVYQTITVGPTQTWDAEELHSDLIINEDAGVVVRDLGAPRDFFVGEDEIEISGTLDAISTFAGQEVMLNLGIDPEETADELKHGWTCELFGYEGENAFRVTDMTSRRFTCIHDPISNTGTFKVTFELIHNTQAMVTKNLFVTDTSIILMHENPAEYFSINPEETIAYVASDDKTIELSMGLAKVSTREDFLDRIFGGDNPADAFVPAVEDRHSAVHNQYLGVAFRSKSMANDIYVNNLTLTLPSEPSINYVSKGSQFEELGEPYYQNNQYPELQDYSVKYGVGTVPAGETKVFYLKFYVDKEYLGDSQYRTLTARADIDYNFIHKESITVDVKEIPT